MNTQKSSWINEDEFAIDPESHSGATEPTVGPYEITPISVLSGELARELLELDQYQAPSALWEDVLLKPTREFLSAPGKSLRRDFVELGWQLAWVMKSQGLSRVQPLDAIIDLNQETPPCPEALSTLIELLHAGSLIVDDIEDQSEVRRGQPCLHRKIGLAPALNIGNWLYFASASLIEKLNLSGAVSARFYQTLNRVMLRCHQGQALDVSCQVTRLSRSDIPSVTETSTRLKSGVLVGFAVQMGGLALGMTSQEVAPLYEFGERVGLCLQMYDDLSGFMHPKRWNKGCEDLSKARLTWIWAWLAQSPEIDDLIFQDLMSQLSAISDPQQSFDLSHDGQWQQQARSVRDQCLPHLSHLPHVIAAKIDHALQQLKLNMGNPLSAMIAQTALNKLKASYL